MREQKIVEKWLFVWIVVLSVVSVGWIADLNGAVTTTNNGDGTTTLRASYAIPTALVPDVRDDICRGLGWTATILCTQPMVQAGQCTSGQLNQQIPNPQTCIQAIDADIRNHLRALRKAGEIKEVEDAQVVPVRNADKSGDLQ